MHVQIVNFNLKDLSAAGFRSMANEAVPAFASVPGGSNAIEAVVRSLRKKLQERASCVETVSGVGYRFRAE